MDYVHGCVSDIEAGDTESSSFYVTLEGDREAHIPFAPGDRLVLVAPKGTSKADRREIPARPRTPARLRHPRSVRTLRRAARRARGRI